MQYHVSVKLYPNTTFGQVQMLIDSDTSAYSYICSEGFGRSEATVTCKQLGLQYGVPLCCNAFGRDYGINIERSNLTCTGSELRLNDCRYTTESCQSNQYASVVCSNVSPTAGKDSKQINPLTPIYSLKGLACKYVIVHS